MSKSTLHRLSIRRLFGCASLWLALGVAIFAAVPARGDDCPDDCQLCEETGGTWDVLACGHYWCGFPQECAAIIPGCDCGPGSNFVQGIGCLADVACGDVPVQVIVDMDADTPGIQSTVYVPACTTTVHDVAVYIIDPLGTRQFWWIGYLGGIDRGIAFGHMPNADNSGMVTDMTAAVGTPVNAGNFAWVAHAPGLDPAFIGPEVQYIEGGSNTPATIPAEPAGPIFTVDVSLSGGLPGDRFNFYLFDFISVWLGPVMQAGAFSTQGPNTTFDTGGDAVPDATNSLYGIDADTAIPVPPASFLVDYIDGPPDTGPAVIEIVAAPADLNLDGAVGAADLAALLGQWGPCLGCAADLDGNGVVGASDLAQLLGDWGSCG